MKQKRIVVTGAKGLIGWQAAARIHAANCAAKFQNEPEPFDLVCLDHAGFDDPTTLQNAVTNCDAILHFAGVNRAETDAQVEAANPAIAMKLVDACKSANASPHIVYANSTHATSDTPYGRSKAKAADILAASTSKFTNLILPHIFGECARPFYNNVTATLIHQLVNGESPTVNPDGKVALLHAGDAAQKAIDAISKGTIGTVQPEPTPMGILELLQKLQDFHDSYTANIYPELNTAFDIALFNTYRCATYPDDWPRSLKLNTDTRGTLFEAVKGGSGGQCFLSTTEPGVTRGDHFHLNKVERFLVIQGQATIRIRKVLGCPVWEFKVDGTNPSPVDMPTLHTHSIENTGSEQLLTLFWTNEMFDPKNPDTFADKVIL